MHALQHSPFHYTMNLHFTASWHSRIKAAEDYGSKHLRSRHPFSQHAKTIGHSHFNILEQWKPDWQEMDKPTQFNTAPWLDLWPGARLPCRDWVTLNRLRTGVRCLSASMHCLGLRPFSSLHLWQPGTHSHHVLFECPVLGTPEGAQVDLINPNPQTVAWLRQLQDVV